MKKSRKLLHALQKANMRAFYAKHKSVYLSLTCGKQIIIEPVPRNMLSSGTPGFCKPCFRNLRCLLRTSLTALGKLMHIISKKLWNSWQIPRHLLYFMPIIIDIIIFRQVDNKRFRFIIKYMVHDAKLFHFFNPNFQGIYFLYVLSGLSPQLLITYLYKHSSLAHTISMGFNMKRYENRIDNFFRHIINGILFLNLFLSNFRQ